MRAKFTAETIVTIRERSKAGELHKNLAPQFGVHMSAINKICSGRLYAWAPGPIHKHEVSKLRKFNEQQVVMIRHRYRAGVGLKKLAGLYCCSARTIEFIVQGKTYKDVGGPRAARVRFCPHCKQVLGVRRRALP